METMILTTPAVAAAAASTRRRTVSSYVHVPETFGALPSMAAIAGHVCTWSPMTDANAIRQAKALKAFGTRRLGESST